MKISFERCVLLLAATLTVAFVSLPAAAAEPVVLKLNFIASDTEMTYVAAIKPFIDAVNKEGKGIIRIDPFTNGGLNHSFPQQAQLVLDGVADIAFIIPSLTPGRFPDNGVLELPGIFRNIDEASTVHSSLVAQNKLRGYDKYFVIGAWGNPPYTIYSHKPIRSLRDLDGMKIAVSSATNAAVISRFGAVPVPMPVTQVAEAIGRGNVDGVLIFISPMIDYGIVRVTSNLYQLHFGTNAIALVMNRAKFDSLPPKAKKIIRKYSGKWILDKYIENSKRFISEREDSLKADPNWKLVAPSAADQKKANEIFQAYDASWFAKDPKNKELFQMVEDETKKLR